jgi:DNA-binding beta-propeller fold protein YncE
MMVFSVHTAWQVAYYHADVPVEMLVYVQTTRDVGKVMDQVETIAYRTGTGTEGLKIAYDSGVSWPFEWYLRDYKSRSFYGTGLPPADAPVVLASFEGEAESRVRAFLGDRYVSQRYELRAWFDESDYKAFQADPGLLIRVIADPALREKLWRFIIYREPLKPSGSTDFVLFVRKDLASGPWVATQAGATAPRADAYASAARQVSAIQTIGGPRGNAGGQLTDPRNVAVGPDSSVYVLDTGNHRVVHFDASGTLVSSFGGQGTGEGQFQEPWGIAVDSLGRVYVADSWNHRIQVFDADGKFIRVIGSPSVFYAPRGIALSAEGQVLVTDTGNHRVDVFNPDGTLVTQIGGRGAALGQFQEPVGIAVAPDGTIYVADTWNHRIQAFDPSFRPLTSWPVAGWAGGSVLNKPYLAVDAEGNVYATDPEMNRVIEFSPTGDVLAVFGQAGTGSNGLRLPTGLAFDAQGDLLVADAGNSRVQRFEPIQ